MKYGTMETTTVTDDLGSTVTSIQKIREGAVAKAYQKHAPRYRVANKKEEMTEYIRFTDLLTKKRLLNRLVIKDEDPTTMPAFRIEYPKYDVDGSYFVVMCWTEIVE